MPIVQKYDKSRPYISSSPSNGAVSSDPFTERYKVSNPHKWGDTHYYNYKDIGTNDKLFPKCRFASEYGFQALPSFNTMKSVWPKDKDFDPFSPFLIQRNHHTNGQQEIMQHITLLFDFHYNSCKNVRKFEYYCYLSQIVQSLYLKSQTEHYRRGRGSTENCMGALYWQLNDVWQAPTWSGIEYEGKWKLLQNSVKDFFEPLWCSAVTVDSEYFEIHATNDHTYDVDSTLDIIEYNWIERRQLDTKIVPFKSSKLSSALVQKMKFRRDCLYVFEWNFNKKILRNWFYAYPFHDVQKMLQNPNIKVENGGNNVKVHSDTLALFVTLELDERCSSLEGRFHPNGFMILPGETLDVDFRSFDKSNVNYDLLIENVTVWSLFQIQ